MTIEKSPINAARIRRIPPTGFSWIDRRFVRQGHIRDLPREAIALYFLLIAVGDANGMSFCADPTVSALLKIDHSELLHARKRLIAADLIAYRYPLYQVLALPDKPVRPPSTTPQRTDRHRSNPIPVGEVLDSVLAQLAPSPPAPLRAPPQ